MPLSVNLAIAGVSNPDALSEFDSVSVAIGLEYAQVLAYPVTHKTGSGYDCTPTILDAISGLAISNQEFYSYDIVIAICKMFNLYANSIADGLLGTPTLALPPVSITAFAPPLKVETFETEFGNSVVTSKGSNSPASSPDITAARLNLFTQLNTWLYNVYIAP